VTLRDNIKAIEALPMAALRDAFREVVGLDVRSHNRVYLVRRIAHVLQERAESGGQVVEAPAIAPEASQQVATCADAVVPTERDSRLPPVGSVINRLHDGRLVSVKVLADSFEYDGRRYRSLSAVAREVTGTRWNGLLFFGLATRKQAKAG